MCVAVPAGDSPVALSVNDFAVGLEKAPLLAIGELAHTPPITLLGARVPQCDLRARQRHLLLDDAAGFVGLRIALGVPLDAIDVLHQYRACEHTDHGSAPTLVAPREHYHLIAFSDLF